MKRAIIFVLASSLFAAQPAAQTHVHILPAQLSDMVKIPSGAFVMGMPATEDEEKYVRMLCNEDYQSSASRICFAQIWDEIWSPSRPAREVRMDTYFIDRREVRVVDYRACVRANQCDIGPLLFGDQRYNKSEHPIVNVTWHDASAYCHWRGKRLPSDAEWEKAARGSKSTRWPWGTTWQSKSANHGKLSSEAVLKASSVQNGQDIYELYEPDKSDGYRYVAPPGSMIWGDSSYGVADMAGNVSEWVSDYYSQQGYEDLPTLNPVRDTPSQHDLRRSTRGGSWLLPRIMSLSYYRYPQDPTNRSATLGFRCAR